MLQDRERRKPTGKTGPISFGPGGMSRKFVDFPRTKAEVEAFVARLFCAAQAGMKPQIKRYGAFSDLQPQRENSIDLKVQTELGMRWLELAEFAPLAKFGGHYENLPSEWSSEGIASLLSSLIRKKAHKNYGSNVILVIYKTHETLFVPPPILRVVREQLHDDPPPFESVYYLSPHDQESASVWELWPGDSDDTGPTATGGSFQVGFK